MELITRYKSNLTEDKNVFPTKELAEAALALAQLLQLRDKYNNGWVPNWNSNSLKYSIKTFCNNVATDEIMYSQTTLTFKTEEIRDEFFKNFRSLLEIAKPLL